MAGTLFPGREAGVGDGVEADPDVEAGGCGLEADPDAEAEQKEEEDDEEDEEPVEDVVEMTWEDPPFVPEEPQVAPEVPAPAAPPARKEPLAKPMSKFLALRLVYGNPSKRDLQLAGAV